MRMFSLVDRAYMVKANLYNRNILKWKTKIWGEIPADFGRNNLYFLDKYNA